MHKSTARTIGILFLLGFAGIATTILVNPLLDASDYLLKLAQNKTQVLIGILFQIIMSFAVTGIAIWMYPVLKKEHEALALWAVGFRIVEVVLQFVSTLCLLLLLSLSMEYVRAGAPGAPYFQTAGALLRAGNDWAFSILSQFAFLLGALIYYFLFYRSRLIPRWLSLWGILAVLFHLTGVFLTMFGYLVPFSPVQMTLALPIAAQELTFAIRLIVKGFDQPQSINKV